jgi:CRISPR-associated protein Cas1
VYDVADLYKAEITIPLAFQTVAESSQKVDSRVRAACRQRFKEEKLLERILPDIDNLLEVDRNSFPEESDPDQEVSLPGPLWDDPSKHDELLGEEETL